MRRSMLVLVCALAVAAWSVPAMAGDCKTCAEIKKAGQGFCEHCGKGLIFGLELKSHELYETLAGMDGDEDSLTQSQCPGCQKAAKSDGFCDHCGIGLAHHHLYMSKVAHTLAKGTPVSEEPTAKYIGACEGCAKNAKDHGFCEHCNMGMVAQRGYQSKSLYDAALVAFNTVKKAIEDSGKCEQCAVARVTDGTCPHCKISYKDGEPEKG